MTYDENAAERLDRLLAAHPDLDAGSEGQLDNLDQFHIGGTDAVDLLIPTLRLTDGDAVLDVGSGFGGPARQIARRTGNRVVGIDITPAYVDVARVLTGRAELGDLVRFEPVDVATYAPETPFQAALTMHVQMNVEDKADWYAHIARHLAPRGRLAVWEACQPATGDLTWPMPWSLDGSDSHVTDADSLLHAIETAGFSAGEWTDESAWVQDWMAEAIATGPPDGPALPALLEDGYTRIINYALALRSGDLQVWRGAFTKT